MRVKPEFVQAELCRILCPLPVSNHVIRCHSNTAVFGAFVRVDIAPSACMHVGRQGSGYGYEPGGRRFESCGAHHLIPYYRAAA